MLLQTDTQKVTTNGEIIVNNHWASIITGEELTDQFELIRSDKYQYITNDFKYINANGNIVTSPTVQDTVAFYSYVVKLFNPDEADMYLTDTKLTTWPAFFVIKENKDGSVALFENEWDNNNFTQNNPFTFFDQEAQTRMLLTTSLLSKVIRLKKTMSAKRPGVKIGLIIMT